VERRCCIVGGERIGCEWWWTATRVEIEFEVVEEE
jgi:hypothetical protein